MIEFNYKLSSYRDFLYNLAAVLQTEVKDNLLSLPPSMGEGFLKSIQFDHTDALIYNYSTNQEFLMKRIKDQQEYYTLVFDEVSDTEKVAMQIDQTELVDSHVRNSVIYLTSFLYDTQYLLYEGLTLRGIRVYLTKEWLQKYLQLSEIEDVLERYISLKIENIWCKPIDPESRELLQGILNNRDGNLLSYQNKILRIVEIFFTWLRQEAKHMHVSATLSRPDIEAAQKIETILTSENIVLPPTIKELSREAAMSESKLKKVFKAVYGLPIYVYFQKQRMQKARIMLLTGNYSIKDIGYSLGYSNLSNFTLAFKKEFGQLPSEVVKEAK